MCDASREELAKLAAKLGGEKQTLTAFLRHAAALQPDAIAIQQGLAPSQRLVTYNQLLSLSDELASKLRKAGVQKGHIVPILTWRKNVELIVAQFAIMLCGAAFAPMDPSFPPNVTKHKLGKAKPELVILQDAKEENVESLWKEGVLDGLKTFKLKQGDCDASAVGKSPSNIQDDASPGETAYVMFTSGSTGNPKGILQAHEQACAAVKGFIPQFYFGPGARVLSTISAAWDISCCDVFATLSSGGTLCLSDSADILQSYGADLDAYETTSTNVPPALISTIKDPNTIARLKVVISGGDKAEASEFCKWAKLGPKVFNGYGLTETGVGNLALDAAEAELSPSARVVPIGKPYGSNKVFIHAPGTLNEVPAGEEGEIVLGGEQIATSYLNEPELSAAKFVKGPNGERLFRTGDLGRLNAQGDVELSGRADEVIKVTGYRIGPEEVQAPLREVLDGSFCCAAAVETDVEQHDAKLALAFLPPEQQKATPPNQKSFELEELFFPESEAHELLKNWQDKLKAKAEKEIAYYARPAAYLPIRFVPLNSNNKQDKKRVKEAVIKAHQTGRLIFA